MTLAVDWEKKIFDNSQPLFTIKTSKLSKLGRERNFFNLNKGIYKKPTTNIIYKSKFFPRKLRTIQGYLISPIQKHTNNHSQWKKNRQKN